MATYVIEGSQGMHGEDIPGPEFGEFENYNEAFSLAQTLNTIAGADGTLYFATKVQPIVAEVTVHKTESPSHWGYTYTSSWTYVNTPSGFNYTIAT